MLTEVTHLQEILQNLCLHASDPNGLPSASEQVILDLKVTGGQAWTYQVNKNFFFITINMIEIIIFAKSISYPQQKVKG